MPNPFDNLKSLRDDMEKKDYIIAGFEFFYNMRNYIVLVKRYVKNKPKYALVKLHFMRLNNLNDDLEVDANSKELLIDDITAFRRYFGIEYAGSINDWLLPFYTALSGSIPPNVPTLYLADVQKAIVRSLSISDSENPNKIYCSNVKRNVKSDKTPGKRSIFNDNKTRLLRPSLYEHFKDDPSVSFCYSENECDENSDAEILKRFVENKK